MDTDKYILAANGPMEKIQQYLSPHLRIVTVMNEMGRTDGSVACIVQVPQKHAKEVGNWLACRGCGGAIYDTEQECFDAMEAFCSGPEGN